MSKPSYERINFVLRPAKNAERKMVVETLSRLRAFHTLDSYRYIGFGSPYFSDFSLVHRAIGITDMICIERETGDVERFEFNRPFECIELEFGQSSKVLPTLELESRPTVIWLDYDDPINSTMLSDIHVVCSSIVSGSFFLITVRNRADDFGKQPAERIEELRTVIGNKLPIHSSSDATNANFGGFLWRIIDSEIKQIIANRSAGLRKNLAFEYRQVLHFDYRDGVRMLTVGGILYQKGQRSQFAQCDFASLSFSRDKQDACRIKAPLLTYKEIRTLDEHLPEKLSSAPDFLPNDEVNAYAEHYRYFPNYIEAADI